jgi:hypothetical protein
VACEFSGVVREAFRAKGHNAWSYDLLDAEDGSPFHVKGDLNETLRLFGLPHFKMDWDLHTRRAPPTVFGSARATSLLLSARPLLPA